MARATLTVTVLGPDTVVTNVSTHSTTAVSAGANSGVQFPNGNGAYLIVNQGGATPSNLTIQVGATLLGQTVTLPATIPGVAGQYQVGPFHSAVNDSAGNVDIDFSSAAGLTVGAFQLAGVY